MNKLRPILLVEDNPEDAELTRLAFEQDHVANPLILKRDGVEALDYLFGNETKAREMTDLPQVVILDLKLPRVNGLEVLKQIRATEATRFLPVVVLTSSNQDRDVTECYRLGVNAYVCKPVDFSAFSNALTQIGHFWRIIEHPADHR